MPSTYEVVIKPGETFAFHDDVNPLYSGKLVATTNAHFNAVEGFKSDGYLVGDGVCHFASLINWAARDAGLTVIAPTNHDFANIPQVPKQYGTSIYYTPGEPSVNQMQNLYVVNNKKKPVRMVFNYKNNNLSVAVYE
jgi:vancomycin resistance protein YoaR